MMNRSLTSHHPLLIFGIPTILFAIIIFFIQSTVFSSHGILNLAVSIDLLLTIPLIYFLLIRKSDIPKTTIVPVMIIGMVLGSLFLPTDGQHYISLFKLWILPVVEISVLTYVLFKVRRAVKRFKIVQGATPDFYTAVKSTCKELMPSVAANVTSAEIAMVYYAFFNWKKRPYQSNEFTHHKRSGTPILMYTFIFLIVIETFAVHLILVKYSLVAAWILTILSVYTGFQIFGFARSLAQRPIVIEQDRIVFRYGILNETTINFDQIEKLEPTRKSIENMEGTRKLSPLGEMESHNLLVHMKSEHTMHAIYGFKKKFSTLAVFVDDVQGFTKAVEDRIKE